MEIVEYYKPSYSGMIADLEAAMQEYSEASLQLKRAEDAIAEALPNIEFPSRERDAETEECRLRVAAGYRDKVRALLYAWEEIQRQVMKALKE